MNRFLLYVLGFYLALSLSQHAVLAQGLRPLSPGEAQALEQRQRPRRIILAIGINSFDDPFWNDLQFADSDASSIYQFFRNEAQIRFDAGELLNSQNAPDGKVSRRAILDALERLQKLNVSEEDSVIVYLSTHGTIYLRKNQKMDAPSAYVPYFVSADTQHLDIQNSAISRDELYAAFQSLKSQRKSLIIASCHSGGGKAQITPEIREALKQLKGDVGNAAIPSSGQGYSILAASSWSEPAVEDRELRQDTYTHFLLDAMRSNRDKTFTLTQAHDIATRQTIAHTKNLQHPTIQMDQSGGDPIVLSGEVEARGLAYLYSYVAQLKNYELRIAGSSKGIIGESYMTVPEGKHRLEIVDPVTQETVASRVVRLSPGKEYSVADLIQQPKRLQLAVGLEQSQFPDTRFAGTFAREATLAPRLTLGLDEAFGVWDLALSALQSASQDETIRIHGQRFPQSRSIAQAVLGFGSHERLPLPAGLAGLNAESRWIAGPALLQVERQIREEGQLAVKKPNASVTLPGLGLLGSFRIHHPATGLEMGVHAAYDIFLNRNQFEGSGNLSSRVGAGIDLGVRW